MGARIALFLTATVLGGLGGMLGSILGNAGGRQMLFIGGFLGGVVVAPLTARIAVWRGWAGRERQGWVAIGAAAGFVLAATIAVNTLSSPVGPVLSTSLVGLGAIFGARRRPASVRPGELPGD